MKKQKKQRNYKKITIVIVMFFIIGVGLIAYPFISNWWNQRKQETIINDYSENYKQIEKTELATELLKCIEYNQGLLGNAILSDPFDNTIEKASTEEYQSRLNLTNDGVMGYIEIPKINVKLSISHGTSSDILKKGVGHLENTSLPVGGESTHAVLSAHTGYPTATLFNDLTKLEEGDVFYLTILGETLAYQVDQIKVVEPSNTSDFAIKQNEDYVTLVTCTPYGVNSHRLLVRGNRIPYVEEEKVEVVKDKRLLYVGITLLLVLLLLMILIIYKTKYKKRRNHES